MKKIIVLGALLATFALSIHGMTPEEQEEADLQAALAQSAAEQTPSYSYADEGESSISFEEQLAAALAASEKELEKEQAKVLKPGATYKRFVELTELATPMKTEGSAMEQEHAYVPKLYKVYQITVTDPQSQENISCGPRDLFFANAINRLYIYKRPIASKTIAKMLQIDQSYEDAKDRCRITQQQLFSDQFPTFITANDLYIPDYYVLVRNEHRGTYTINSYQPVLDAEQLATQLAERGQQMKENVLQAPIHFICNDAAKKHWVLISIFKYEKSEPVIYYIDSKNIDIEEYPVAQRFIAFIVEKMNLTDIGAEVRPRNIPLSIDALDNTTLQKKSSLKTKQKRQHRISVKRNRRNARFN